jgi:hypothetical protein
LDNAEKTFDLSGVLGLSNKNTKDNLHLPEIGNQVVFFSSYINPLVLIPSTICFWKAKKTPVQAGGLQWTLRTWRPSWIPTRCPGTS